ncbi:MAG: helix-turn-helix transcriptional regulator [Bacteroidetes bacterium]|nr:helix-turn-helix transcriptional regulator [Bacteroidota bacterium]
MEIKEQIGKNLEFLKVLKNVTNNELKDATGLKSIGNYMAGSTLPPVNILVTLAEFFDVTLDELVRYDLREEAFKKITTVGESQSPYGFTVKLSRMERAVKDLQEEVFKGKSPGDPKK